MKRVDPGHFRSVMLAAGQQELARLFAPKAPEAEKFAGVAHSVHDGIPVIEGTLAWVGCRLERLVEGGCEGDGRPLPWFRGAYRT